MTTRTKEEIENHAADVFLRLFEAISPIVVAELGWTASINKRSQYVTAEMAREAGKILMERKMEAFSL